MIREFTVQDIATGSKVNEYLKFVKPTPCTAPTMMAYSEDAKTLIDLSSQEMTSKEALATFSGNSIPNGSQPSAASYAGHQFGFWAGQLGDGRAISLGEVINAKNERWEIQLKGAGMTPFSRNADGRAVIRSSVREFLASEALHHLNIPTTRALCLVSTGDTTYRDQFYSGDIKEEPTAIVTRLAPSFLRFGTFELPASRGNKPLVSKLLDYTIEYHFPHLKGSADRHLKLFDEIVDRTAQLMAKWAAFGFVHGVMNTDNMSIHGLTIDYGPFGFLEEFDPNYTSNLSDRTARYAFKMQPAIALWNLTRFANCFEGLIDSEALENSLNKYEIFFQNYYQALLVEKFGLIEWRQGDSELTNRAFQLVYEDKVDFTRFFRSLSSSLDGWDLDNALGKELIAYNLSKERIALWKEWMQFYIQRISESKVINQDIAAKMNAMNPKYILRNYMAQVAIEQAEKGDFQEIERLQKLLSTPFDEVEGMEKYAAVSPEIYRIRGIHQLSCSS